MILSRLTLDPRGREVRRDLANAYELHSTLSRAFDGSDERFLWRLESHRPPASPVLLVQSTRPPDWAALEDHLPGYASALESKPLALLERLEPGRRFRFRLRANPTVTKEGKRHGLARLEDQLEWLERQGAKGGFGLVGYTVSSSERLRLPKRQAEGRLITLQTATYDGHLDVTDPERLREAVGLGLGHAKALGCGLLSLAPDRG